jgi:ABC-2 type transport system ATP-binding protein
MQKEKVIVTENLTKRYRQITAVDNLNLEIYKGEICGLLGPNGAGKTTTILMLLGLTEPTSGRAEVLGLDPLRNPLEVKRSVGYLPEHVGFYENLTGRENLNYIAALNGLEQGSIAQKIDELAEQVGLYEAIDRRVGEYSHGMRQRLGLASCLVKSPKMVILDEPTVGIDPQGINEILNLIARLSKEEGITVLLSSHLLYQVQQICDRVAIFVRGKVIAMGPIESLGKQLMEDQTLTIELQCLEGYEAIRKRLPEIKDLEKVEESEGKLLISCKSDQRKEIVSLVQELGLTLLHLRLRGFDLDDIYQKYFQGVESHRR